MSETEYGVVDIDIGDGIYIPPHPDTDLTTGKMIN